MLWPSPSIAPCVRGTLVFYSFSASAKKPADFIFVLSLFLSLSSVYALLFKTIKTNELINDRPESSDCQANRSLVSQLASLH